jgi:spermidine synthase
VVQIDHVELDTAVIDLSREHFEWGTAWDDPRCHLHITDGAAFVRDAQDGYYDVIIQDSSDPFVVEKDGSVTILPSQVLYTPEHFAQLLRILSPEGIFTFQAETYNIPSSLDGIMKWRQSSLDAGFTSARYGTISISSYPTGQIGFYVCAKQHVTTEEGNIDKDKIQMESVQTRFEKFISDTSHYHPRMQQR